MVRCGNRSSEPSATCRANKVKLGIAREFDTMDFHVEAIDLLRNRASCECGVALNVAIVSAIKRVSVQPALVILGDISIQGNIKGVRTLVEPCQLAMENGARLALIPIENRRRFLEVSGDVAERLDPIFYGNAPVAANKALGINSIASATGQHGSAPVHRIAGTNSKKPGVSAGPLVLIRATSYSPTHSRVQYHRG